MIGAFMSRALALAFAIVGIVNPAAGEYQGPHLERGHLLWRNRCWLRLSNAWRSAKRGSPERSRYRAFSAKNLRGPISSLAENGSEQSSVGLKIDEAIGGGWVALGKLDTGFNPLSGEIANSCASLGRNNGRNQLTSTSNSDGNRCGQALDGLAFGGLSNPAYGTLTAGRQDSLDLSLMSNFDPMALAPPFSTHCVPRRGPWQYQAPQVRRFFNRGCPAGRAPDHAGTAFVDGAYASFAKRTAYVVVSP